MNSLSAQYQNLLNSKNYVTRRQSLKLLGELLLDRHNFNTMTKYISNPDNLRLMMELLRDKSRNIQYEAFHVFKVFVANPNKPKPISDILNRNREKLVGRDVFHLLVSKFLYLFPWGIKSCKSHKNHKIMPSF